MCDPADVSVLIPTIPGRDDLYHRALASVYRQTALPGAIHVWCDRERQGAAVARQGLLGMVTTPWLAWLDDDDELLPHHLAALCRHQDATGADVVYPDARRVYDGSPALADETWSRTFDHTAPAGQGGIPVTVLARTGVVRAAGFDPADPYEDWGMWVRAAASGATFAHLPEVTWVWHIHPGSTSGRPG